MANSSRQTSPLSDKISLSDPPARGAEDATVTIYHFSDFQCPYGKKVERTLANVLPRYEESVRHVFVHMPLEMHEHADEAAKAALAARRQGAYWKMHQKLFRHQKQLGEEGIFAKLAGELMLDVEQFEADMASDAVAETLREHREAAKALGVDSTPTFFIGGQRLNGSYEAGKYYSLIEAALERAGE